MTEVWMYRETASQPDITGFDVEAKDGSIGKIDEATYENGSGSLVVDTGWWIFGKKRMIPAGVIETVDLNDHKVFLALTKDQVKSAPDYDEVRREDERYREEVSDYYDRFSHR